MDDAEASEIESRIKGFNDDVQLFDSTQVVQRHITGGECFALDPTNHYELRRVVAAEFGIHPNEVAVVGSAKLGFSIAPDKRYRHFGDGSDIDVAMASSDLFDRTWWEVFRYHEAGGDWEHAPKFKEYLFEGWIRPDMLPRSESLTVAGRWWDFFLGLTSSRQFGEIKINGALYKSWAFLEAYQSRAVDACRLGLST